MSILRDINAKHYKVGRETDFSSSKMKLLSFFICWRIFLAVLFFVVVFVVVSGAGCKNLKIVNESSGFTVNANEFITASKTSMEVDKVMLVLGQYLTIYC
jgi:hypothetical protein